MHLKSSGRMSYMLFYLLHASTDLSKQLTLDNRTVNKWFETDIIEAEMYLHSHLT